MDETIHADIAAYRIMATPKCPPFVSRLRYAPADGDGICCGSLRK